eukprot:TRINITY_DN763_c0_g1_i1.p2 TRINITY_DN763_c0_g1~~TRINITY_DN763_c0_g1_i1.p2  ORF type:complete len:125 (+),score=4.72 TRINITY_DN763_c0_g1_i1:561-935(+)
MSIRFFLQFFNYYLIADVENSEISESCIRMFVYNCLPRDCWLVELQSFDDKGDIIYDGSVPYDATVFSLRELRGSYPQNTKPPIASSMREPIRHPEPAAPAGPQSQARGPGLRNRQSAPSKKND